MIAALAIVGFLALAACAGLMLGRWEGEAE
jgi:hypothetical protein